MWFPEVISRAMEHQEYLVNISASARDVNYQIIDSETSHSIFGFIVITAGLFGSYTGGTLSKNWREEGHKNAEAMVCWIGAVFAAVCSLMSLMLIGNTYFTIKLSFGTTFLALWTGVVKLRK